MRTTDESAKTSHCVQCGKKLSFLRQLAGSRFCCEAHEQLHDSKTEAMMLQRLRIFD